MCFSNYRSANTHCVAVPCVFPPWMHAQRCSKPNEWTLMWPPGGTSPAAAFGCCPGTCDPPPIIWLNSETRAHKKGTSRVRFLLGSLKRMLGHPCATAWAQPLKMIHAWRRTFHHENIYLLLFFPCETFVLMVVFAALLNSLSSLSWLLWTAALFSLHWWLFHYKHHAQGEWKLDFVEGNVQGAVTQQRNCATWW